MTPPDQLPNRFDDVKNKIDTAKEIDAHHADIIAQRTRDIALDKKQSGSRNKAVDAIKKELIPDTTGKIKQTLEAKIKTIDQAKLTKRLDNPTLGRNSGLSAQEIGVLSCYHILTTEGKGTSDEIQKNTQFIADIRGMRTTKAKETTPEKTNEAPPATKSETGEEKKPKEKKGEGKIPEQKTPAFSIPDDNDNVEDNVEEPAPQAPVETTAPQPTPLDSKTQNKEIDASIPEKIIMINKEPYTLITNDLPQDMVARADPDDETDTIALSISNKNATVNRTIDTHQPGNAPAQTILGADGKQYTVIPELSATNGNHILCKVIPGDAPKETPSQPEKPKAPAKKEEEEEMLSPPNPFGAPGG